MCVKIHEDVEFIREVKYKHLRNGDFEPEKVKDFIRVDDEIMANWKESVVRNIVVGAPPSFSFMIKFSSWKEAIQQLQEMHNNDNN